MNSEVVGKNLKSFREALSFKQDQLADFLGIERGLISYYENGKRAIPAPIVMRLADFFGVSIKDLIEENPNQSALNKAFAFRAENITSSDLEVITSFKRIAKNYIESKEKLRNLD